MTTVLPPRSVATPRSTRPARAWNPVRDGGPCNTTQYDFQPDLWDDDAYIAVPSGIVQLCERCPFRTDCLDWAMKNDEYGFWAGTSRYQRLQLDRQRHRVKCPSCGSVNVMQIDRSEICASCGISWSI